MLNFNQLPVLKFSVLYKFELWNIVLKRLTGRKASYAMNTYSLFVLGSGKSGSTIF